MLTFRSPILRLCALVCLIFSAALAIPLAAQAANWYGERVVPRSAALQIYPSPGEGRPVSVGATLDWPVVVGNVDGQWLQVHEGGGYAARPARGWVRKSDVLRTEEVQAHCNRRLEELGPARSPAVGQVYWLRGIYWEQVGELENALADYKAARDCHFVSGDVLLRLARTTSKFAVRKLSFQQLDAEKEFAGANKLFADAEAAFRGAKAGPPPLLYLNWGDALRESYRFTGNEADAQAAHQRYRQAEDLAPTWFLPPQAEGELLVDIYDRLSVADQQPPDTHTLLQAVQCLSQAIRLNPNAIGAYRRRAEALLRLANASGPCEQVDLGLGVASDERGTRPEILPACSSPSPAAKLAILNEALRSADRAYELGHNREPRSLEAKANVQRALALAIYAGHPPQELLLDAPMKAKIATAQSLLSRASQLAEAAANYSQAFDEIDRRLTLAADCGNRARRYADILNGDKQILIAEAKSKISKATLEVKQLVKLTADEQRQAPRDSTIHGLLDKQRLAAEALSADVASLNTLLGQPAGEEPVDRRQLLSAVTKLEQGVSNVQSLGIRPGNLESNAEKATPTLAERDAQLKELSATIEQARSTIARLSEEPVSVPSRPSYTPLFLGASE